MGTILSSMSQASGPQLPLSESAHELCWTNGVSRHTHTVPRELRKGAGDCRGCLIAPLGVGVKGGDRLRSGEQINFFSGRGGIPEFRVEL